jgi:hypothetical protein
MKLSRWTIVGVIVSSLLVLATGLLWVRSCDVFDVLVWSRASVVEPVSTLSSHAIGIGKGRLILYRHQWTEAMGGHGRSIEPRYASGKLVFERQLTDVTKSTSKRVIPWHGFETESSDAVLATGVKHERTVWMPLWFPALLCAAFPLFVWIQYARKAERIASGRCARCGYDLRSSPEQCPECGMRRDAGDAAAE